MGKYNGRKNGFDFGSFVITKREILASISIAAVMLLAGVLVSDKISEHQMDRNEIYNKAVKIESTDLFQHGMDTNIGNAFVYGGLLAIDTVTYPEIGGEYMYVRKVKERYTKHKKTETYTTGSGKHKKRHTRVKTYWTWDKVSSHSIKCKEILFCGVIFSSNKINIPDASYIDTVKKSSHTRYKYYGTETKYTGTIFANLRDKTIPDKTAFYNNKNIEETIKQLESGGGTVLFWTFWIILVFICIFGFYYLDNKWLE